MVPGAPGVTGPSVVSIVVEELKAGRDSVIIRLRHMVVKTVMVRSLKRDCVIPSPVQVISITKPKL